ncbi:neuropeptide SIFamide receptor-like [Oculina patagonica]
MPISSNRTILESAENRSATTAPALWFIEDDVAKGAQIAAFLIIFLACLIGNSLLIAVVYKNANQRMRTPSNYFIVNLACADMFLVAYMVPQNMTLAANDYRWLITGVAGEVFCSLFFFAGQMPVLVSTGSLFFIALDRYFLVFYPLKRMITLRIARRIIAAVWIFAIVFTAPLFIMGSLIEFRTGYLVCTFDFSIMGLVISYFLFGYIPIILIPLIIIIILYIAIGYKIKRATPPGNQLPSTQERRERMTHKVLAMLVAVVVVLIVFRFPLLIGMIACFTGLTDVCHKTKFMFVAWFLTFSNSAVNPFIYFIFNEHFRHGARVVLERVVPFCFKTSNEVAAMQTSVHQMTHSAWQLDEIVHMDHSEMH